MALVRGLTDISITVQDIYTLDNALGWTQGTENCFTYEMKRHPDIGDRVQPPAPGDDCFDDALERFLMLSADNDGDGEITLKEFRHFVRRRVSKGEPSPYAAFLTLQRKLRKVGNLGDQFWDQRGLELVVMMKDRGLWSAKELSRRPRPKDGDSLQGDLVVRRSVVDLVFVALVTPAHTSVVWGRAAEFGGARAGVGGCASATGLHVGFDVWGEGEGSFGRSTGRRRRRFVSSPRPFSAWRSPCRRPGAW